MVFYFRPLHKGASYLADLEPESVPLFDKTKEVDEGGVKIIDVKGPDDPVLLKYVDEDLFQQFNEELELLSGVIGDFSQDEFLLSF